ncbi:PAS domain S-box protein [Pedobacter gandavensis]|uniref:histidine kinase n=1 Tax=Pedobacter gandavensis TaxID=2679963 RepID=A0ABR6EWC1_9SPHI|nr:PAS domain S-box protein [Pedobacter gandavensis]MBB2148738.1 PAS domain S-box protein [Pedobacter gandavensis]
MNLEKKLSSSTNILFKRPKVTGAVISLLLITLILYVSNQRYRMVKDDQRMEMNRVLNTLRYNVDQSLKNCYTAALTLGLTISGDGKPKDFEVVAAQLMSSNPNVQAIELVPGGVIKYIYPLKGNEAALNLDVFHVSKEISLEARKAVMDRKMYFAGPMKLKQGGIGIVGRMPLFFNNKFWGFSAVVIKLDAFLKEAGIQEVTNNRYAFQLSKLSPVTGVEEFFLPKIKTTPDAVQESVTFSDGNWKLYMMNIPNYKPYLKIVVPTIFAIFLAGLSGFLVSLVFKRPAELQQLVLDQASRLLENQLKFKTIFDQAAIGIMEVESNTGRLLHVNPRLCKILGYSAEELESKRFQMLSHPDDIENGLNYFERMERGEISEFELLKRYLHKDGTVVWANLMITPLWLPGTKPTSHIAIVEDVTAKIEAERIAIEYRQRIESLVNTIDGIVWEANPFTFEFAFVSEKSKDILGYTSEEWLGSPTFWVDHIHPEDREYRLHYCYSFADKLEQHDFEYRMIAKDGSVVWLRDIVNVVVAEGKVIMLRGIMIDITKNKQAERDLNHSFDLVNEQNKRLLNFSYIVSHNLRSHTSNIQSIAALIESATSNEERNEMVTLLKTVSNSLNETLLNLNKVVNIQTNINVIVEPLALSEYINRTLDVLQDQIVLKKARIINNVAESVLVNYNPAYLESIMLNFIFNAIRYSHPERPPVIELTCEQDGQVVLKIKDNGIGMDLEKHGAELFGMYKTFNGNADSRGVGLFISKNQIDAMGGKVTVESEFGIGTTFRIFFK